MVDMCYGISWQMDNCDMGGMFDKLWMLIPMHGLIECVNGRLDGVY